MNTLTLATPGALAAPPGTRTLAEGLARPGTARAQQRAVWALARGSLPGLLLAAALVGGWMAWAPLAGAVRASGVVKPELDRRTLQHLEGGLVRSVHVQEGQAVRRGDALLTIGDARQEATLALLAGQVAATQARVARAGAELRLAAALGPDTSADAMPDFAGELRERTTGVDLSALGREAWARERLLFDARRRTLDEQTVAIERQIAQLRSGVEALGSQAEQARAAARYVQQELALNEQLAGEGFVSPVRVLSLQRQLADTRGRVEASNGQAADTQARIAGLRQTLAELRGQYQQRAADERREAETRLIDLQQQLRPLLDQAERQVLRAPVDGRVMQLRAKVPGLAVGPREPLLELAPSQERLIVEARIAPEDIDHVRTGAAVQVHVTAFDASTGGPIAGSVRAIAPDAVATADGTASWYLARIEVDPHELASRPGLALQAGMPVEAYVATTPRSVLAYLADPFTRFARRAMREP